MRFKQFLIFLVTILFLSSISLSHNDLFSVELKNGNTITGKLLFKDETNIPLQTEFGELVIPKENIQSINSLDIDSKESSIDISKTNKEEIIQDQSVQENRKKLNQKAM
jgi:hypothetical protein